MVQHLRSISASHVVVAADYDQMWDTVRGIDEQIARAVSLRPADRRRKRDDSVNRRRHERLEMPTLREPRGERSTNRVTDNADGRESGTSAYR